MVDVFCKEKTTTAESFFNCEKIEIRILGDKKNIKL